MSIVCKSSLRQPKPWIRPRVIAPTARLGRKASIEAANMKYPVAHYDDDTTQPPKEWLDVSRFWSPPLTRFKNKDTKFTRDDIKRLKTLIWMALQRVMVYNNDDAHEREVVFMSMPYEDEKDWLCWADDELAVKNTIADILLSLVIEDTAKWLSRRRNVKV